MIPIALAFAALAGVVITRRRRRAHLPAQAVILSPRHSTVVSDNGAVRSVQSAELTLPAARLEQMWSPSGIENLARTYWRFLSRMTLGLIRVIYGENERRIVLIARPLTLLRFAAPEYELEPDHATVRWRILDGLLVARAGRGSGFLALDVRKLPVPPGDMAKLRVEVEVANFYPSIAANLSQPVYEATQSAVHVIVTHAFLRSLAKLDLAKSKVGRFARSLTGTSGNPLDSAATSTAGYLPRTNGNGSASGDAAAEQTTAQP